MERNMEKDDSQFDDEFGSLLRDLDDGCPPGSVLIAWSESELDSETAARMAAHVEGCGDCASIVDKLQDEPEPVDDLTWARARQSLDQRAWPWQRQKVWHTPWAGAAAAAVAIVAVALVWFQATPPDISPVTRGVSAISVMSPVGAVDRLEFRWQTEIVHDGYIVEVASGEELIASRQVGRPPLRADQDMLEGLQAESPYRWRVRAIDARGETIAQSGWTEFQLGE